MVKAVVEEAVLENMTQELLRVSTVFLVQQSELLQVKERLSKELARVSNIQDTLTTAAQLHQDAVLAAIQNYESLQQENINLQCEVAAAASPDASVQSASTTVDPPDQPQREVAQLTRERQHRSMRRQVQLPPIVASPIVFMQEASMPAGAATEQDDEDEGIKYVDKLQVAGGMLGEPLKASGEFVGTPQVQWFRQRSRPSSSGAALLFVPLEGASQLEYLPNADDVGVRLRVECVGPYGGTTKGVDTDPIGLAPNSHAQLSEYLRKGHAEFTASSPQRQEQLIILVTRKNIKVRSKLSRLHPSATTLYKQGYDTPLSVNIEPQNCTCLQLKLGPHVFQLVFDTQHSRDLAALCIRMFAGPNCPAHDSESEADEIEPQSACDKSKLLNETPSDESRAEAVAHVEESFDEEVNDVKNVQWSGDEEEEEQEFKPAITVSIRSQEEACIADNSTLKSFSLGIAPPKPSNRTRGKSAVSASLQEDAAADLRSGYSLPAQLTPTISSTNQEPLANEFAATSAAVEADSSMPQATPTQFNGCYFGFDTTPFEEDTNATVQQATFAQFNGGEFAFDATPFEVDADTEVQQPTFAHFSEGYFGFDATPFEVDADTTVQQATFAQLNGGEFAFDATPFEVDADTEVQQATFAQFNGGYFGFDATPFKVDADTTVPQATFAQFNAGEFGFDATPFEVPTTGGANEDKEADEYIDFSSNRKGYTELTAAQGVALSSDTSSVADKILASQQAPAAVPTDGFGTSSAAAAQPFDALVTTAFATSGVTDNALASQPAPAAVPTEGFGTSSAAAAQPFDALGASAFATFGAFGNTLTSQQAPASAAQPFDASGNTASVAFGTFGTVLCNVQEVATTPIESCSTSCAAQDAATATASFAFPQRLGTSVDTWHAGIGGAFERAGLPLSVVTDETATIFGSSEADTSTLGFSHACSSIGQSELISSQPAAQTEAYTLEVGGPCISSACYHVSSCGCAAGSATPCRCGDSFSSGAPSTAAPACACTSAPPTEMVEPEAYFNTKAFDSGAQH